MITSCPNLKDKKIAAEFEELVKALDGNENAAYQIWSMNNGNSIDMAPNGEPSILFADLLAKYNGDRVSAIKDKAISFADNFIKTSEDANGEVLLKDLYTGIRDDNPEKRSSIKNALTLQLDQKSYVQSSVNQLLSSNPNATNEEVVDMMLNSEKEWANKQQEHIIGETQKRLINAFGLVKTENGYEIPGDNSEIAKLRIQFINSMSNSGHIDTFRKAALDHYVISIGLERGDATTFNHELAHYYIRQFKNSKLVQFALDMYAKDGMSIDDIEEALVNAITERSTDNEFGQNLENQSFFHKFWYGFNTMLYKVFNIKTTAARNSISDQITKAFLVNDTLDQTKNDIKYQLSYHRMYQSEFQKRRDKSRTNSYKAVVSDPFDVTAGKIIDTTRSRQKSYDLRMRNDKIGIFANEEQAVRNAEMSRRTQELSDQLKRAKEEGNNALEKHIQATLYLEFLRNAYKEAHELRVMMLNAEANQYRRVYYQLGEDGSKRYVRESDDSYLSEKNQEPGMLSQEYIFDDLEYAKTDIIGYFTPIVQSIRSLTQSMESQDYSAEDINAIIQEFDNTGIEKILYDIERTYNDGLRKKVLDIIDDIVDSRTELDPDLKQRLRVNMYKWLNDQMDYGDVKAAEVWIGLGTRSKSPILRAVHDMLADMQDERDQQTYKKAIDLMDLKRKAEKHMGFKYKYFYNVQKLLVQLDKKGLPTGNWLSEINDGQYYIDRDEFRDQLLFSKKKGNWKYNTKSIEQQLKELKLSDGTPLIKDPDWRLEIDRLGAPIMPDHPLADEIYKNYMRDMETWISEHSDRPYTLKYYLDRIDYLSTPTLKAVNEVNAKINSITRTVIRNGKPRYELLTQNQMRVLSSYEAERKDLGNFYDADNQLKNKDSVEYKIAYDLMMWNRKTSDKIKYVTDFQQYKESKAAAKNPVMFERMFSHVSINPRLWEIIKLGKVENPAREVDPRQKRLINLQYQRSLLMSRYQGDRIGEVKWSELFNKETGRLNNINFWKNLQRLDREINTLSNELNQDYPVERDENQQGVYFSSIMSKLEIPYSEYPTGKTVWGLSNQETWRSYIQNRLVQSMNDATDQSEKNDILSEIQLLSFYNIARSVMVPVSIFSSYIPREEETIYNGEKIKDFVRTPVSLFAKIDKDKSSSEYVNKNYNESDDSSVQPKKSLYRDKRWDIINDPENKPLKDLYDALKKTMEQSFEMIPFSQKYDNRLSQMGARTGQILGRKFRTRFHKNLAEFLRREFSVVDTDYEFRTNDDKEKRPDGSDIENIPVRFIKRLEKPQYINLDVVGSTIAFYDMALNYKIKAQHASELTAIFNRLEQNQLGGQYKHLFDAKQSEVLEGMLQRQLYEKQVTAGGNQNTGSDNLIGEKEWPAGLDWIRRSIGTGKDWLKRVGKLRIMFQTGMLALNATSAIVSFLDPLISLFIDSITGKYINYKDVGYAVGMLFRYSGQNFLSLGKIYSYGKAAAAMQRFQLSKGNMSTFRDTDQSQVMRFISDGLTMKYFTVGDYTINAINMIATMHNYRYYKDSTGNAKFYSKPQFIQKVMQDKNCDVNQARSEYNSAQTMWNSCSVNDKGGFVANNDEYGNAIDSQTFTQLRKQIRSRSSLYNGIVPDIERTYLQTNILWSFVTLLRNFLITGVWERFQTYRDFQVSTFDESGNPVAREATSQEVKDTKRHQNYYKGGYSFATKQIENSVTWSATYALSHMIPYMKYAYYLATHKGSMSKYDTQNQQYMKEHNLNQQDVYGLQKMFMECMAWMSLMLAYTFTQKAADEDENNYTKQLVNLLTLRLAIERYTWYSPQTAMELIQSPTTALADWKRKMMIFGLGADIVGLTGKDIQEPIKRGYYQHEPTWKYDVFNIFSHYGLHNWYKTMPEIMIGDINVGGGGARALKNTTNFYRSLRPEPVKWLQDAQEDSSTKQKRSKKSSNSNFESGFGSNFSSNFSSNFGSNF